MRNPKWHRDEIILALDLYFDPKRGSIDDKNRRIIELSKLLNKLPLFSDRPDQERFRNPNGVTLKLSNFLAFDPNYHGKGMTSGSRLDKIIFNEFSGNQAKLHRIANNIREVANDARLISQLRAVEEDDQTVNDNVIEGQTLYRLHKVVERDSRIIKKKKDQALRQLGKLACEACSFEFQAYYGEIGYGFIECHHRTPLASFKANTKTTLDDLALVCSNCHRMLHRKIDTLTIDHLRVLIKNNRILPAN